MNMLLDDDNEGFWENTETFEDQSSVLLPDMTLVIGLVGDDSCVLASDSQGSAARNVFCMAKRSYIR
jgi:hypothetical protein